MMEIFSNGIKVFPYSYAATNEKAVKESTWARAYFQGMQIDLALARIEELGRVWQSAPSLTSRQITFLGWFPYMLSLLIVFEKQLPAQFLREGVHCIHEHAGTVAHMASIVLVVALISFGQIFTGSLALAFIAIGEMRHQNKVPKKLWLTLHWSAIVLSLWLGSWQTAMSWGLSYAIDSYIHRQIQKIEPRFVVEYRQTDISSISSNDLENHLQVEESHFSYPFHREDKDLRSKMLRRLQVFREADFRGFFGLCVGKLPAGLATACKENFEEGFRLGFGIPQKIDHTEYELWFAASFRKVFIQSGYNHEKILSLAVQVTQTHQELWQAWLDSKGLEDTEKSLYLFLIESGILSYKS